MSKFRTFFKNELNFNETPIYNNIYQLTNDPNIRIDQNNDNYIGYEHVGEYYSGKNKKLTNTEMELGWEISELVGDGVFLDVGCGDGLITVPVARNGTKIIAGDISNKMVTILQHRASVNHVLLDNVILCRFNALDLPIKDNSMDCVVANGILHLISNPKKVIKEIYRVLKPNGIFISLYDKPGGDFTTEAEKIVNKKYLDCIQDFDSRYWDIIINEYKIMPEKISWNINKEKLCDEIFNNHDKLTWEFEKDKIVRNFRNDFLYRHGGKGYSNQANIPDDIHNKVFLQVKNEFETKLGREYYDYEFHYIDNFKYEVNLYTK